VRRFWTNVTLAETEAGYILRLDERPMRLPGGAPLLVPSRALAEAIAAEWREAGDGPGAEVAAEALALTRLAGTAQERIAPDPAPTVAALARYGETDLLCYRATSPESLVQRQSHCWQPLLDWAALTLDAPLHVTSGVIHRPQPPDALAALHRAVAAYDPRVLAGLSILVPALGSLVLGLAVVAGRLDAAEAHALATLDEIFQAEFWGEDAEAAEGRARVGRDIAEAARFIGLARA